MFQQTPRSLTALPPSLTTLPPDDAEIAVMEETPADVMVGVVVDGGVAVVVKLVSLL